MSRVEVASRISRVRKSLGLTQAEFGQLLGAHLVTISRWESGHGEPSSYQLALLDEFERAAEKEDFGRSIKYLLVGAGIAAAIYALLKVARDN